MKILIAIQKVLVSCAVQFTYPTLPPSSLPRPPTLQESKTWLTFLLGLRQTLVCNTTRSTELWAVFIKASVCIRSDRSIGFSMAASHTTPTVCKQCNHILCREAALLLLHKASGGCKSMVIIYSSTLALPPRCYDKTSEGFTDNFSESTHKLYTPLTHSWGTCSSYPRLNI